MSLLPRLNPHSGPYSHRGSQTINLLERSQDSQFRNTSTSQFFSARSGSIGTTLKGSESEKYRSPERAGHTLDHTIHRDPYTVHDLSSFSPNNSSYFTRVENVSLEKNLSSIDKLEGRSLRSSVSMGSLPERLTKTISAASKVQNFDSLFTRIRRLKDRNAGEVRQLLKPGTEYQEEIEKGYTRYYEVTTKDMFTPLTIVLKRESGSVEAFISKKDPAPSPESYEAKFSRGKIIVSTPGLRFTDPAVYMSITASADADFVLSVQFGVQKREKEAKNKALKPTKLSARSDYQRELKMIQDNTDLKKAFDEDVERIKKRRKEAMLKLAGNKNIVVRNSNLEFLRPSAKRAGLKKRRQEAEHRRQVYETKQALEEIETLNRYQVMYKKEIRIIREQLAQLIIERKKEKLRFEKIWFQGMFAEKITQAMRKKFLVRKEIRRVEALRNQCASSIQRAFKTHLLTSSGSNDVIALRQSLSLKMVHGFCLHARNVQKRRAKKNLSKFMRRLHQNLTIPHTFDIFYKRILFMQGRFKRFIQLKQTRMTSLRERWQSEIDKLFEEEMRRPARRRDNRKKESRLTAQLYASLREEDIEAALDEWYLSKRATWMTKWIAYRAKLKGAVTKTEGRISSPLDKKIHTGKEYLDDEDEEDHMDDDDGNASDDSDLIKKMTQENFSDDPIFQKVMGSPVSRGAGTNRLFQPTHDNYEEARLQMDLADKAPHLVANFMIQPPAFEYLPTDKEMRKLIERTAQKYLQSKE